MDVPAGPRKSDYLYTNFLPNFPPISIPFSKENHPIWIKLGAFYNNLPKIHLIYVIWAPSSLMKTPRSLYQISWKSAQKGRHIHVYHVNVRTPPGCHIESSFTGPPPLARSWKKKKKKAIAPSAVLLTRKSSKFIGISCVVVNKFETILPCHYIMFMVQTNLKSS